MDYKTFHLAQHYFETRKFGKAAAILSQYDLIPANAEHICLLILLADCKLELEEESEALDIIKTLLSNHPDNIEVIDAAISVFSAFEETVADMEILVREQIEKFPDDTFYIYTLAHSAFYHLDYTKEKVLQLVYKLLPFDDVSYLELAIAVFTSYGRKEEREECITRIVEISPDSYKTRKMILNQVFAHRDYEEFADLAIDFVKDYPEEEWVLERVEEIFDYLYDVGILKFSIGLSWKLEEAVACSKGTFFSTAMIKIYSFTLWLTNVFSIVLLPFSIARVCYYEPHLHISRLKNDPLYSRLSQLRDRHKEFETMIVIHSDSSDEFTSMILEERKVTLGKDFEKAFYLVDERASGQDMNGSVQFEIPHVSYLTVNDSEVNFLDSDKNALTDEPFSFASLKTPLIVRKFLANHNWKVLSQDKEKILEIIYAPAIISVLLLAVIWLALRYKVSIYLLLLINYVGIVIFCNIISFLYFRLLNRRTVYTFVYNAT